MTRWRCQSLIWSLNVLWRRSASRARYRRRPSLRHLRPQALLQGSPTLS